MKDVSAEHLCCTGATTTVELERQPVRSANRALGRINLIYPLAVIIH